MSVPSHLILNIEDLLHINGKGIRAKYVFCNKDDQK